MQLSNKWNLNIENPQRLYAKIAIKALVTLLISIAMSLVLYFLKDILHLPINMYFMIFLLMITQTISVVAIVTGLLTDLYQSKDNQILLSLPAKSDEIFISKLLVYYIHEFLKNLFLIVPLLIGYGAVSGAGVLYYFNIIPMTFFLPLIAILIGSLLTIPIVYMKNFLKSHQWVGVLLTILLIGLLFIAVIGAVGSIPHPIRIVQLYNRFVINLSLFMQTAAAYAGIYAVIGFILGGYKAFVFYLLLIGVMIALFLGMYFILRPLFFGLTSKSSEFAVLKKHKDTKLNTNGLFFSFLRKEWIITIRSANEVLQNYASLFALPIVMYVINYIYMGLNRSTLGNQLVIIFNVMIALLLVTSANTASATAISKEGSEFVLLKTAPSDTSKIAWAKMTVNFILSIIIISLSFFLFRLVLPVFPRDQIWYLYLFVILVNGGHIVWSFQLDIMNPKLSEYASTGSFSGNPNINQSISIGFVLSLLFGALSAILFIFFRDFAWPIMLGIATIFILVRFYLFNEFLKAYFMDIEL